MAVENLRSRGPLIPETPPVNSRNPQHHPRNEAPLLPNLPVNSQSLVDSALVPPSSVTNHKPRSTIIKTGLIATRVILLLNRPSLQRLNDAVVLVCITFPLSFSPRHFILSLPHIISSHPSSPSTFCIYFVLHVFVHLLLENISISYSSHGND